jgi:hypothetical protein
VPGSHRLVALTLLVAACSAGGHPGGDPDGALLARLRTEATALAKTADLDVTRRVETPAHWDSCDGDPDTAGWNDVGVMVWFADGTPSDEELAAAFLSRGWAVEGGLRFHRRLGGRPVSASVQPYGGRGRSLLLRSPPPGPAVSGC